MTRKSVCIAMSGGVDSSVAAYLLKKEGYKVAGIHLQLWSENSPETEEKLLSLEQTCHMLQIPLTYLDVENEFKTKVVDYFCQEYRQGRTPNPCVVCNKQIKFGILLDKVIEMGAEFLATGHYARVSHSSEGYQLLKGIDRTKDQSYFLYRLGQRELNRILFPIGELKKSDVKKMAAELGLPAAKGKESHDICFIPGGDYHTFLAGRMNLEPGDIVDTAGKVLGKHRGLAYYTVGQRQGTGVSSRERLYVVKLDTAGNRLVLGPQKNIFRDKLVACDVSWITGVLPPENLELTAKVRYRTSEVKVRIENRGSLLNVYFEEQQKAIAPGQSVVFYSNEIVLGGGIIVEAG